MFMWLQHVNVSYERKYLLGHIQFNSNLKMRIFRKTNVSTRLHKNGHNSTCDHYFFMKLVPLDSAHIGLSIHAKNSVFIKKKLQMVYFSIAVTYAQWPKK